MSGTQEGRSRAEIDEVLAAARLATMHAGAALIAETLGPRRERTYPALIDAYERALAREQAVAEAADAAARTQWSEGGAE